MMVVFDLDGTIAAAPRQFQPLMSALQACGHSVTVLTGTDHIPPTQQDWQEKCNYLTSLGCGQCWDELVVLSHPVRGDIAPLKAKWLVDHGADLFIDNDQNNADVAIAAGIPLVLVPWASKEK